MARTALLWCLLALLAGSTAAAEALPGGVVCRDGADLVYRALDGGAPANLTEGVEERAFGPADVSRDGHLAVWLGRTDFRGRMLPGGPPFALPVGKSVFAAEGGGVGSDHILSVAVSPSRRLIAYELEREGRRLLRVALVLPRLHGDARLSCAAPVLLEREDLCLATWAAARDVLACATLRGAPGGPALVYEFEGDWRERYGGAEGAPQQEFSPTRVELAHEAIDELAWRPDGTLTYLRRGIVHAADGARLFEGEVRGVGLHWIDEQSFLFRGWDGALYAWTGDRGARLLEDVPKEFTYCGGSPVALAGTRTVRMGETFTLGPFETEWCGNTARGGAVREVWLATAPLAHGQWQFALPAVRSLEEVADPSVHLFRTAAGEGALKDGRGLPCVAVPLGEVVLMGRDGLYGAARPLKVESTPAPPGAAEPVELRMTCAWRLWPAP